MNNVLRLDVCCFRAKLEVLIKRYNEAVEWLIISQCMHLPVLFINYRICSIFLGVKFFQFKEKS